MDSGTTGAETLAAAFAAVDGAPGGLTPDDAAGRLVRFGRNELRADRGTHPLAIMVGQFSSPMVVILLGAAALTLALGETTEGLIIALIVVASGGLGFYQEFRATSAIAALRQRLAVSSRVLRGGAEVGVPSAEVVPGDIVLLAAGTLVPADGVLVAAHDLELDEAALTGESFPAAKAAAGEGTLLTADNRVHMGTSVRSGTGRALILATGAETEFGAIAHDAARAEPETSFAKGIRRFGVLMTRIMMVIIAIVVPVNILLGRPLLDSLLFSIALAVGITPELLPAIVTVTLSRGAQRLAKAGVLVRRLVAIENLGAMDLLCTDKTGTLTEGVVRLDRASDPQGEASDAALFWAAINARLQTGMPNQLDEAIVAAAAGIDTSGYGKLDELPYDFERKRLSVLVQGSGGAVLICKGAVAQILPLCNQVQLDATAVGSLTPDMRRREQERFAEWSNQGFRVLAVAIRHMGDAATCAHGDETSLTLVGYLLFSDPPKPGVRDLVESLGKRGVALKIITGDNRIVAAHVAETVGLKAHRVITGDEIGRMTDRALARRAVSADIFAEITPDQKERIVAALRRSGKAVGYMGDGINDAPALRAADIGISVDSAVDAAKEAADVVLLRQDLGVLLEGIVIGRTAFANTLKYITITTSANVGNMISMALASLFLPFLPMLATQILLNNLLSDLPLVTISTDRVDEDVVARPGRWDFRQLLRSMIVFGVLSSLFDGLSFAVLLGWFGANEPIFQTGWFIVSLLTEIAVVAVMRTRRPFFTSAPSRLLIIVSVVVAAAALVLPYVPPLADAMDMVALPAGLLAALGAVVVGYVAATELLKRIVWRDQPSRPASRAARIQLR